MTLTTHAAIGTAIGYTIHQPLLGFTVGLLSHFLVDMIPHGDSVLAEQLKVHRVNVKRIIAYGTVDAVIALILILAMFNVGGFPSTASFTAAVVGSILPDLLIGIYELTKTKYLVWFNRLHFFFHDYFILKYKDTRLTYALAYQAVAVILIIKFL